MQLKQFEKSISKKILSRGKAYFEQGYVTITELDESTCYAEVEGTYNYEVEIEWENDLISDTYCNCPDDYNDPCKHVVATLFALREELKHLIKPLKNLDQQLVALSKEQLIQIIIRVAEHDPSVRRLIQYQLEPDTYALSQAKETILQYIRAVKGRFNYIPSYMLNEALEGFYDVLDDAEARIKKGELLLGMQLILLCYEQLLLLTNYEDEEGEIGAIFIAGETMIQDILKQTPSKAILDAASHLLVTDIWHDFDEQRLTLFLSLEPYRQAFTAEIHALLKRIIVSCRSNFSKDIWLNHEYEYILLANDQPLLTQFSETYKDVPSIRKKSIYYAIEQQQIPMAIQLTKQGIVEDQEHLGLLIEWQRLLYSLYEMQDNPSEMEPLAIALLLNGQQEFYNELQYIAKDWLTTQQLVLDQLAQKNASLYTTILVEQHLTERLLQFCQQHPMKVFQFFDELYMYTDKITQLVRTTIFQKVKNGAASRSHYQEIARYLKAFKAAGYTEETKEMMLELVRLYPRKKALIDELQYV